MGSSSHIWHLFTTYKWLPVFLIAALMTNLGYGDNLLLALGCEQYYFEYLLFFTLVYGAKLLLDGSQSGSVRKRKWFSHLLMALLVAAGTFLILWAYNIITNCPFDPVLFTTTRMPLIVILSMAYQHRSTTEGMAESKAGEDKRLLLNCLDGSKAYQKKDDLSHFVIKNGLLRVTTHAGAEYIIKDSLKEVFGRLNDDQSFYRANRSTIIHRMSVESYESNSRHQLEVTLNDGTKVLINKNQSKAFKTWMLKFPL